LAVGGTTSQAPLYMYGGHFGASDEGNDIEMQPASKPKEDAVLSVFARTLWLLPPRRRLSSHPRTASNESIAISEPMS
jgi:hypothetical protein